MEEQLQQFFNSPALLTIIGFLVLFLVAWITNFIVKKILVRGINRLLRATPFRSSAILGRHNLISRLANLAPALVVYYGVKYIPGIPEHAVKIVNNVCSSFITLVVAVALSSVLDFINELWKRRPHAADRPIKGYLQVIKIAIFSICIILIIADLFDKDPKILLTGLGAMAAVILLIFQDTLLSLVASVQITTNNMIKIGDWVEMPQYDADGDVIDIALHTITIQNWDKTITTIPTKKFMTDSFKNWRGMEEAGGRRIKRSLLLDQNSVHFLTEAEEKHLRRFHLLKDYLDEKEKEITNWNKKLHETDEINFRRVTNLGTFRAYVERYLRQHSKIHNDMTLIVRQLSPTPEGIPLELYCFTNDTRWVAYEAIQSDIFDHMLAILPEFGLRVFQNPGAADFCQVMAGNAGPKN